jgi:hypothetical protein
MPVRVDGVAVSGDFTPQGQAQGAHGRGAARPSISMALSTLSSEQIFIAEV